MIEKRDVSAMMRSVAQVVREYVQGVKDVLTPRIEGLERSVAVILERKPEKGEPGKDGRDGIDGKDGIRGEDGISVDVLECIRSNHHGIRDELAGLIPSVRDGKDGQDGKNGERGADGLPGAIGFPGIDGQRGADGKDGQPGRDGKDAVLPDIEHMVDRAISLHVAAQVDRWALDFERRAQERFQAAIDKMPMPKDGRDAFELEDVILDDDGATFTIGFKRGDLEKSRTIPIPGLRDKGVHQEGIDYTRGDSVSFGGSLWIAQVDHPEGKPRDGSADWRLAVKHGRDGRDLRPGDRKVVEPVKL